MAPPGAPADSRSQPSGSKGRRRVVQPALPAYTQQDAQSSQVPQRVYFRALYHKSPECDQPGRRRALPSCLLAAGKRRGRRASETGGNLETHAAVAEDSRGQSRWRTGPLTSPSVAGVKSPAFENDFPLLPRVISISLTACVSVCTHFLVVFQGANCSVAETPEFLKK